MDWVDVLFDEILWHNQPLGRDIAGSKETVSQISREAMLRFFQEHYSPANCVVSVAGPFPQEYVLEHVQKTLGDWPKRDKPAPASPSQPTQGNRLRIEYKKTEQANLCIGVPSYSYNHPDRFPTDLLNVVLGEGMSSRLFQEIRERRGLAYDVHSYVHHLSDTGSTVVYAGVEPRQIDNTLKAILEQLELLKEPILEDELMRAKESWKGRMILRLEDTKSIASWMGSQEMLLDRIMTVDEVIAAIERIEAQDLNRIAKDLFRPEQFYLSVVGPFKSDTRFAKLLGI
jgi:predicted Zn-dependent peptidase